MLLKPGWEESKKRFEAWWNHDVADRVLLQVHAPKSNPTSTPPPTPKDLEDQWLGVDYRIARAEWTIDHTYYGGDAFPSLDTHIGPGTLSLFIGAIPEFQANTVWYHKCIDDITTASVPNVDENNRYWRFSQELAREGVKRLAGKALVTFPDLIEGLDTIASLVGNDELLFYLVDAPDHVHRFQRAMNDIYFYCYDRLYEIIKDENGGSAFSAFHTWAPGRVAKVQCDFSAMISPKMYEEFVVPYLAEQCSRLDYSVFHLDGPCCVQHLPLLLEIEELDAIQWTPTTGTEAPCDPKWWPIYKQIRDAGKSVMVRGGTAQQAKALVEEFGPEGLDILIGASSEEEADDLVNDSFNWRKRC
jgi:hypothetical protein